MTLNLGFMCGYTSRKICWFRFPTRGFVVRRTRPLFSERHGYKPTVTLWFGWRFEVL